MRKIIAVIGDADISGDEKKKQVCLETGKALIDRGFRVSTGGLGGVMEAVMQGARMSEKYCEGDTIAILPGLSRSQANEYADIVIPTSVGILRNGIVTLADAVIAIGGGAGTLSESAFAWSYKKLLLAFSNVTGTSSKIAGTKLDYRIRYPEIPDDQVWAVTSGEEAAELIEEKLPLYNKEPGFRRIDI
ncbi:MAG: hypothetical protein ACOX6J_03255 [Oscillospiraceae bacterium]|jgi:uncharacterized protein (TIGR00725 family)